jgi:peptidyl-prolyl cis-trans isomerase A (cyclophilin A)/peptidyl-prolyl cis-trans isomerase B (cyclophilin B)
MRTFWTVVSLASFVALTCFVMGCGSGDENTPPPADPSDTGDAAAATTDAEGGASAGTAMADNSSHPQITPRAPVVPEVVFETTEGKIKVRLNTEKAPRTVENFLQNYVQRGLYNGTIFHQVDKGFMVVGGAFTAELEAVPTRTAIFNEAADANLSNRRGTIAMARDPGDPHSATNLFFFNLKDNVELDHKDREKPEEYGYCVFGEVVEGMDVLDRIAELPVKEQDGFTALPTRTVRIDSIRPLRQLKTCSATVPSDRPAIRRRNSSAYREIHRGIWPPLSPRSCHA